MICDELHVNAKVKTTYNFKRLISLFGKTEAQPAVLSFSV